MRLKTGTKAHKDSFAQVAENRLLVHAGATRDMCGPLAVGRADAKLKRAQKFLHK